MRVVTAAAMAAIDRETIDGGVPGLELMERAGREMTWQILRDLPELAPPAEVLVLCGRGNNGGDGLVVARHLEGLGFEVRVLLTAPDADLSPDAAANLARLGGAVAVETLDPDRDAERLYARCEEAELVVDAVFGTGVRPPLRPGHRALFAAVNAAGTPIVALDVPSGVSGDDGSADPDAIRADATITVGLPKLGLLVPPGRDHAGRLSVVDIGFPEEVCDRHAGDLHWLLPADVADLLPARPSDLHKYAAGTVLVLAGSERYGGAALLAARGALRSGAGLVTLALPERHAAAALGSTPEAPLRTLSTGPGGGLATQDAAARDGLLERQDALVVGPGLGDDPDTDAWILDLLAAPGRPVVIDADALSAWSRAGCEPVGAGHDTVLTPHAGELARLAGIPAEVLAAERLERVAALAARWNCVLVAKGSPTLVASPEGGVWINPTGDDALAHGGTGDVLAGLLGGLMAQGLDGLEAALLGCWLHGRAGELAAEGGSRRAVLAGEVAAALPAAYAELELLRGEDRR